MNFNHMWQLVENDHKPSLYELYRSYGFDELMDAAMEYGYSSEEVHEFMQSLHNGDFDQYDDVPSPDDYIFDRDFGYDG